MYVACLIIHWVVNEPMNEGKNQELKSIELVKGTNYLVMIQ